MHTKPNKSIQYVHFFAGGNAAKIDDIAIDDLRFVDCNPKAAPPAMNCTFDSGTCGWLQDKYDQFDWTLNNGSTASRNTGPTNDHTFGDGSGRFLCHLKIYNNELSVCVGVNYSGELNLVLAVFIALVCLGLTES